MADPRVIVEGTQFLGVNEGWTFTIDITNVGSSPTGISVTAEDADGSDVTSTLFPTNTPTAPTSTTIKLSKLVRGSMVAGGEYRVIILFTVGDQDPAGIIPIEAVD